MYLPHWLAVEAAAVRCVPQVLAAKKAVKAPIAELEAQRTNKSQKNQRDFEKMVSKGAGKDGRFRIRVVEKCGRERA